MIKLYGYPVSNYYHMVLIALLEKGFDFEEVVVAPSQDPEYLKRSPMGKIPCIGVREGYLSETTAILEFLEEVQPDIALLPEGAYKKAKCRELMRVAELYIDLPARRVVLPSLMKQQVSESVIAKAQQDVQKGFAAIARLARFSPWLSGDRFSYSDILLFGAMMISGPLADMTGWDPLQNIDGLADWHAKVAERHSVRTALEAQAKALPAFLAHFDGKN